MQDYKDANCYRKINRLVAFIRFYGSSKFRYNFESIAHDTVIGHFEKGRLGILIDDDDGFGSTHTRQMLDSAGDADGDVQVGANGYARLTHVLRVGAPSGIRHRFGAGGSRSEYVGQFFDYCPVFGSLETAASGDHDFGVGQGYFVGS